MALQQVFIANMKKYRTMAGLTQEKLAELCDTDPHYIGQIETSRRFPSIAYIERIAAALNIMPHQLFYDETNPGNESMEAFRREQKQKIKNMLMDNINQICVMLDEQ